MNPCQLENWQGFLVFGDRRLINVKCDKTPISIYLKEIKYTILNEV